MRLINPKSNSIRTVICLKSGNDFSELERHDDPTCPECKKGRLVEDVEGGEIHCRSCGFVAQEKTEVADVPISKDSPRILPKSDIPINDQGQIGPTNKDFYGNKISTETVEAFKRLRTWDARSLAKPVRDRNLAKALPKIFSWSASLNIGDNATNNASKIYQKAVSLKLIRGRSIEEMAAAAVLSSCKINGIPRSDRQVAQVAGLKLRGIRKAYKLIFLSLDLSAQAVDPKDFIPLIASKINLEPRVIRLASEILDEASAAGLNIGKMPMALAASALYLSSTKLNVNVTQLSIALAADVSEVTIRNRSHLINKILKQPIYISTGMKKENHVPEGGVKDAVRDRPDRKAAKIR